MALDTLQNMADEELQRHTGADSLAARTHSADTVDVERGGKAGAIDTALRVVDKACRRTDSWVNRRGNRRFYRTKKPLHLTMSGFFAVVDRRSELGNHVHKDLEDVEKYLQVGEGH